jgi:hypothetical protein
VQARRTTVSSDIEAPCSKTERGTTRSALAWPALVRFTSMSFRQLEKKISVVLVTGRPD